MFTDKKAEPALRSCSSGESIISRRQEIVTGDIGRHTESVKLSEDKVA